MNISKWHKVEQKNMKYLVFFLKFFIFEFGIVLSAHLKPVWARSCDSLTSSVVSDSRCCAERVLLLHYKMMDTAVFVVFKRKWLHGLLLINDAFTDGLRPFFFFFCANNCRKSPEQSYKWRPWVTLVFIFHERCENTFIAFTGRSLDFIVDGGLTTSLICYWWDSNKNKHFTWNGFPSPLSLLLSAI